MTMLLDIPAYYLTQISLLYGIISMESPPGKQLPPRFQLARIYSTSENTVRKALSALQKQGVIDHGKGHTPRVLFDPSNKEHWRLLQQYYPIQTGKVMQIIDSACFIIPPFFLLGLARMDHHEISSLLEKLSEVLNGPEEEFWPLSCFYLATLLYASKNSSVTYYYIVSQLSLHCAFNTIAPEARQKVVLARKKLYLWLVQQLSHFLVSGQAPAIGRLSNGIDWYYRQIAPLLLQASTTFPDKHTRPLFVDFQQKYLQICFEIAHRIFSGEYHNGMMLPSDTVCATEFNVAITTARRAYQLLMNMGLVKAVARVGTLAIFPPLTTSPTIWTTDEIHTLYPTFLDQFDFFRRHIRRVAALTAKDVPTLGDSLHALTKGVVQATPHFWSLFFLEYVFCLLEQYGNETYTNYFVSVRSLFYFGLSTLNHMVPGCVQKTCEGWIACLSFLEAKESAPFAAAFSSEWKELNIIASEAVTCGDSTPVTPFPVWKMENPDVKKGENH